MAIDANIARAAGAYQNRIGLNEGLSSTPSLSGSEKPTSFSDMLGETLQGAVDSSLNAEKLQIGALNGQVELTDLVTAIAEAELTVNTIVTVRDRVVAAYQEISRMPV